MQTLEPNVPIAVEDFYQELFHYPSAAGLVGIVESQCLRATHAAVLNDVSEIKVFFGERLPLLIERGVRRMSLTQGRRGMRQGSIMRTGNDTTRGKSNVSCTQVMRSPSRLALSTDRT
jgi:hypothetical protein